MPCCCHWQKFLSLIPMRRKKVSVLLLQLPRLSFVCSTVLNRHLNARIQTEYRISKGTYLSVSLRVYVLALVIFLAWKRKWKIHLLGRELLLHLEFLPFLAATDISKGLTRTRQLYVCFKGLDVYFFPHFTEALLSKQPINTKKFPTELH